MARIVNDFGALYRLSERNYRRFLQNGAASKTAPSASDYGKCIGTVAFTATDATPADFQFACAGEKIPHLHREATTEDL